MSSHANKSSEYEDWAFDDDDSSSPATGSPLLISPSASTNLDVELDGLAKVLKSPKVIAVFFFALICNLF